MLEKLKSDLQFIYGKYHKTDEPFNSFARMSYHGWDCDATTGLDDARMQSALEEYRATIDGSPAIIKAKLFAFVLDNMRFAVDEHDFFPCLYNWNRPINRFTIAANSAKVKITPELENKRIELFSNGDINCWPDYDHSVPDWDALYSLGFIGIRDRARKYRTEREFSQGLTPAERDYFDAIELEYSAILRLIARIADYTRSCTHAKAETVAACLDRLAIGAPTTLYERLMLIYLYFMLSESVDSYQVRSLGSGLDHDLAAPFKSDLESGKFTEDELDCFIGYFLVQFVAIGNYWGQPMYLGGTNLDGSTRVCDMSYRLLKIYDELGLYNPKIQVKYSRSTPISFLYYILDMIRRGHSSFVFVCEDNVRARMLERGIALEDCFDFDVKGCYEYALRGDECSTAPYYVNLLGGVVRAVDALGDDSDFPALFVEYELQTRAVFEHGIAWCREIERSLPIANPATMLSATYQTSLECARDAYYDGSKLNTTAFVVGGIGSAVDALIAVKTLVYDEKCVTLSELKRILDENWSDTRLRARAFACKKYGCGDPEADALGAKIADIVYSYQGIDNHRGGYFKVTMHSARQYIELGAKMHSTPDGRMKGEETSKNASPTQGMDKNGVTALIRSACALTPDRFDEGFGFDVMLHESAVKGDDGLDAMYGLLMAYESAHGSSIQFNICSAETLRDAQENPQRYESLQIRVCGWNVLWNNMPKSEQDKFIERAENII